MRCVKAKALRLGLTEVSTKVSGKTIKQMERVFYTIQMGTFMKENGSTTKLMDMELIHTQMAPSMLESGKTISKMALECNNGLTEKSTKDNTKMEVKLGRAYLNFWIQAIIKDNS